MSMGGVDLVGSVVLVFLITVLTVIGYRINQVV
jgi:hypothetical protein